MAVQVITGGVFTKDPGARPGLYVRFIEKAIAAIGTGARSKVALVKTVYTGTAELNKVYRIRAMSEAITLFGEDNVKDIELIIRGGASEVVVVAADPAGTAMNMTTALEKLETYEFHVMVVDPTVSALQSAVKTWAAALVENGKNFIVVYAATDETPEAVKTNLAGYVEEYEVFVTNGVIDTDGTELSAGKYAYWVAGKIAGTALSDSLTYLEVPFSEVKTRYRSVDIKELLASGGLVTVMDGDQPRIEQGLTNGEGQFGKIRIVRAKQAMIDDIDRAINDNYIGKITNNPDGQIAVINAIKTYLETLANGNVISADFVVELDTVSPSVGADLYINIGVRFLDSIEYIYLTVTV